MNKVCHDNTIKRALFDVADKVVLATSDKKIMMEHNLATSSFVELKES